MVSKRMVLHFPKSLVDRPIVFKLIKDYDLEFNILKAYVSPREEGLLVLELRGKEANYNQGIEYLKKAGVKTQPLSQDIIRREDKCTQCSICVPMCPTDALIIESSTRKVIFDNSKCIACEICTKVCPYKAMEVYF